MVLFCNTLLYYLILIAIFLVLLCFILSLITGALKSAPDLIIKDNNL